MGVEGLWKLIEQLSCGNPVTLESLENVILAIDCSIWLNQVVKGTREREENHHLLNLFKRICKLMHFKIKPVFVFDGGVPEFKRKTINARKNRNQDLIQKNFNRFRLHLKEKHNVNLDLKSSNFKSTKLQSFNNDKLFYLEDNLELEDFNSDESDYDEDINLNDLKDNKIEHKIEETNLVLKNYSCGNFSNIDTNSEEFLSLPPELRHEILTDIKESKKFSQNNEQRQLPENMGDFSNYQVGKLIKNHDIQKQIEKTRKEMFSAPNSSSFDLKFKEEYEQYISTRIASDDITNLVFTKKKVAEPPKLIKSIEKPKKNYDTDIYGKVEDYDYGITESLDSESKVGLINDRLRKKIEIKNQIKEEDSSTDDDDFIEVKDEKEQDDLFEKLDYLSQANPIFLNLTKLLNQQNSQQLISKDKDIKKLNSPNKRQLSDLNDSLLSPKQEAEKKLRKNLITDLTNEKNKLEETAFNVTINLDETLEIKENETIKEYKSNKKIDKSDTFSDFDFSNNTEFEEGLNKFLDNLDQPKKQATIEEVIIHITKDNDQINDINNLVNKDEIKSTFVVDNKIEDNIKRPDSTNNVNNEIKASTSAYCEIEEEDEIKESEASTSKYGKIEDETLVLDPIESKISLTADFLENEDNNMFTSLVDKKIIDKISPKKKLKLVELKPPTEEQLASNKILKKPKDVKVDLSETIRLARDVEKAKRQTNTVAATIIEDTKELLNLFGIPFVISPMEAEAQCATLELLGLTKGTITDDSDVWLFGAKTVYKNFFNQSKFVMKYTFDEIQSKSKLTRENLICFAMLTGSDYTEGISGVGPVAATEIISEFSGDQMEPLIRFKDFWLKNKDKEIKKSKGKKNLRDKFLKYELPKVFPNERIFQAYKEPEVDNSTEKFQFGQPDLDLLRKYTYDKFNWSKQQADDLLLPMFKRINDRTTQSKISYFFQQVQKVKKPNIVDSKRLQNALDKKTSNQQENKLDKNVKKSTKEKQTTIKKTNKLNDNKKSTNQETLKNKVLNQRKKKTTDNIAINNKEIKISDYFNRQIKPVNRVDSKVDHEIICLSEDSE